MPSANHCDSGDFQLPIACCDMVSGRGLIAHSLRAKFLISVLLLSCLSVAQEEKALPPSPSQSQTQAQQDESTLHKLGTLPIEWLIGPYIPASGPFTPLTGASEPESIFNRLT